MARTGDRDRDEEKRVSSAFLSKELGTSSSTFSGILLKKIVTPTKNIYNIESGKVE